MTDTTIDASSIHLRFDGLEATRHLLPAKQLAQSISALDRIIVRFLVAIETVGPSKRSPPPEFASLMVAPPREGSFDMAILPQIAATAMPFVGDMTQAMLSKVIEHIIGYVLLSWGGRKAEADAHMEKLLDILDRHALAALEDRKAERAAAFEDRQREREHVERILRMQAELHQKDAREVVTPIGRSCTSLVIGNHHGIIDMDEATAEAVRSKAPVEVSDVMEQVFAVDGIQLSSKVLTVFDPDEPGRKVKAHISDPALDPLHPSENPYEAAVRDRKRIKLTGKMTRSPDGRLLTFHAISGEVVA